jgi:hypothetical protein
LRPSVPLGSGKQIACRYFAVGSDQQMTDDLLPTQLPQHSRRRRPVQLQCHLAPVAGSVEINLKPTTDKQNWLVTDDGDDSKMVPDRRERVTVGTRREMKLDDDGEIDEFVLLSASSVAFHCD